MSDARSLAGLANPRRPDPSISELAGTSEFCGFQPLGEQTIATLATIAGVSPENPKSGP